jgi:23S rRNA (cytidine1920-2'-O)/16S rRNA (cytidine1409-2'-O)-methyltransferase
MEERLDKILVDRGLVTSRTRAEELIKNGDVLVNGQTLDKPGKKIALTAKIILLNEELAWVSRGALKLLKALETFSIDVTNKVGFGWTCGAMEEVYDNIVPTPELIAVVKFTANPTILLKLAK